MTEDSAARGLQGGAQGGWGSEMWAPSPTHAHRPWQLEHSTCPKCEGLGRQVGGWAAPSRGPQAPPPTPGFLPPVMTL